MNLLIISFNYCLLFCIKGPVGKDFKSNLVLISASKFCKDNKISQVCRASEISSL